MGIVNIQTNQTDQCPNDSLEYPQNDQEYHYKDMGQQAEFNPIDTTLNQNEIALLYNQLNLIDQYKDYNEELNKTTKISGLRSASSKNLLQKVVLENGTEY